MVVFYVRNLPIIYKKRGNKINDEYVDTSVPIIENQILKAGIRLARVLNEVFKN
ncbi:S1/P1 nuclease [Flavobacterium sp.]|uniref:S1/P1 nuclease n=1 Tax=Flavobacterium sp. TaxID=239 RepID=UPI0037C075B1